MLSINHEVSNQIHAILSFTLEKRKVEVEEEERKLETNLLGPSQNNRSKQIIFVCSSIPWRFLFAVLTDIDWVVLRFSSDFFKVIDCPLFSKKPTIIFGLLIHQNRVTLASLLSNAPLFVPKVDNVTRLGRVPNLLMCITWTFLLHKQRMGDEENPTFLW